MSYPGRTSRSRHAIWADRSPSRAVVRRQKGGKSTKRGSAAATPSAGPTRLDRSPDARGTGFSTYESVRTPCAAAAMDRYWMEMPTESPECALRTIGRQ